MSWTTVSGGADGAVLLEGGVRPVSEDVLGGDAGGFFDGGGDVEAEHCAYVVFVDDAVVFGCRLEDEFAANFDLCGGGLGNEPAVTEAAGATLGVLASAADPDWRRGLLDGFGDYGNVFQGEEFAVVSDLFLLPEAADDGYGLVGSLAAVGPWERHRPGTRRGLPGPGRWREEGDPLRGSRGWRAPWRGGRDFGEEGRGRRSRT